MENKNISYKLSDENIRQTINNANKAIKEAVAKTAAAAKTDADSIQHSCDAGVTGIKNAMLTMLDGLKKIGFQELVDILESEVFADLKNNTTIDGWLKASVAFNNVTHKWIDKVKRTNPSEATLRKVIAFEQENDERQGILTSAVRAIVWVFKWMKLQIAKLGLEFTDDPEHNFMGHIGAVIASIFGLIRGLITSVLSLAINCVIIIGSHVAAAIITVFMFVWNSIKKAVRFAKDMFAKKQAEREAQKAAEQANAMFEQYCGAGI